MNAMFSNTPFNQDISGWDVSNVTNMFGMFIQNFVFNQDISSWDVSSVNNMRFMFLVTSPSAMNQDLSGWSVGNVTDCLDFADGTSTTWTQPKPNFTACTP